MTILKAIGTSLLQSLIGVGLFFLFVVIKTLLFDKTVTSYDIYFLYILYIISIIVSIIYIKHLITKERILKTFKSIKWSKKILTILLSCLLSLCFFIGLSIVFHNFKPSVQLFTNLLSTASLFTFISILIEELIFRYYILGILKFKNVNANIAIITSSICFSLVHYNSYNFYVLIFIVGIGICFGMLYYLTNTIAAPIGLHFANNYLIDQNKGATDIVYNPDSFSVLFQDSASMSIIILAVCIWWFFKRYLNVQSMKWFTINKNKV